MAVAKISENLFVSAQICPQDFEEIKNLGIKTIICHRPDGEDNNQATFKQTAQQLKQYGVEECLHQPVVGSSIAETDAYYLEELLNHVAGPVLMYCRSGTRSMLLWCMIEASHGRNIDELIQYSLSLGIDLSAAKIRLQQMIEN